ncbi:MAG: hypothetical protein WBR17_06970 [Paraburkholderia sp.]|uniref:hypothetical protein n=1 Tax=Paraburkholderia sp. TaxID=1926495 RepID=UPI003C6A2DF7
MPKKITAAATKKSGAAIASKRSPTRQAADAKGWRRADGDHTMIQELGQRMRALREAKGLLIEPVNAARRSPDW